MPSDDPSYEPMTSSNPFRSAVIRGLGVLAPPLLTVVIIVWVINTTRQYLLEPVNVGAREAIVWLIADVREDLAIPDPIQRPRIAMVNGNPFYQLDDGTFVPNAVWDRVRRNPGEEPVQQTGKSVYQRYVELTYLRPYFAIPCFLAIFLLLVYLLGKFMAAGIGGFLGERMEYAIHRLPFVRSVYSAIKQVSNFFFSKKQVQFTRVVAVEYPRRGIWTVAFVTSDGLKDVRSAANEPTLGLFIPSSPMPMSGYAVTVLKREVIDLNITIDQAVQHLVSCGLVMPPGELERLTAAEEVQAVGDDDGIRD